MLHLYAVHGGGKKGIKTLFLPILASIRHMIGGCFKFF